MLIHGSRSCLTQTLNSGLLGLTLVGALAAGCSSTAASVQQQAATQPQGSVRLEEVADWEFEASHPSSIDAATLDSLLRAVVIAEAQTDMSNLPVDGSKPMTVFSDEDVRYLAPLLAQALSQAQPEYVVAFRLSSSAGSGSEPTAGTLYVKNDRLYLTLSEHNGSLAKTEPTWLGSGRPARVPNITPTSAGLIEQALPAVIQGRQHMKSLSIDYRQFAKKPEPAPMTASTTPPAPRQGHALSLPTVAAVTPEQPVKHQSSMPTPAMEKVAATLPAVEDEHLNETLQELQDAKDAMARKDAKISALRRDLESMRMQLETKDKELRAVKSTQQTQPKRETRNKAELTAH
ncbi:MAG: conserved exported protein of unknown function [Nitrospira sp.]|nr:hypothetical protein [Nitrospira sp.]ULA58846.1 MAG: conserved exported protein of unknown function [Nitrospira sp.]